MEVYCDIWEQSSGNGQNWETETVQLEGDGEMPEKLYREMQLGGNQSVSKLMDFGSFLKYSKFEG